MQKNITTLDDLLTELAADAKLDDMDRSMILARVRLGMDCFDQDRPGWFHSVTRPVDMDSLDDNILAQVSKKSVNVAFTGEDLLTGESGLLLENGHAFMKDEPTDRRKRDEKVFLLNLLWAVAAKFLKEQAEKNMATIATSSGDFGDLSIYEESPVTEAAT